MKFRSCYINPEQVRLLLFKECDWRGRKLLFDSSTIYKVPASKHDKPNLRQMEEVPCIVEVSDGFSYVYKGPEADATVLGEMIFGAVAMNYKSVSLKIHIMDEPRRLMCTKVFCVPTSRRISRAERKASDKTSSQCVNNVSPPLNVPLLSDDGVALSFSMDRGDSGFCDHSSYSSVGSTFDYISMFDTWDGSTSQEDFYSFHSPTSRKLSTSSNGSWQRRTFQNIATRFQLGQSRSENLLNVPTTTSDSQIYSNSSASGTSDSIASGSSVPQRKNKLGIAVLITVNDSDQLDIVRKCLEHCPQVQALVCRLRARAMVAGARGKFVAALHAAAADAARWLSDLIYGPRLQPLWLSMVTSDAKVSNKLADFLLSDLCSVLAVGDTKTTNFFMSTLLTHVLTYHLGWVTTVSPYDTIDHQKIPPNGSTKKPYNALWAQLSDLCGNIGFPARASRTIISGEKNTQFVNKLLSVLTYFLRCGDVKRTVFEYQESVFKETKTVTVNEPKSSGLKRTPTRLNKLVDCDNLPVAINTQESDSVSTLVPSEVSLKKTATLADLTRKLSTSADGSGSSGQKPTICSFRRNPTMMHSLKASSDSSLNSSVSEDSVTEQKVLFVLGDDEKLVGLKNKSTNGKCVKKSSKVQNEPVIFETRDKVNCENDSCKVRNTESPSKCCEQTLQHSKPIKHSGFKFEFDKYPQIVTNYMKSKNLEILDRHYIGKPGNLKLDNYQFDPMVVPPIQEEKCDSCVKCKMMEFMLQTPTNASEMEYMNDMPRHSEPQYAKETVVSDIERQHREMSPKTFVRRRKENVVVVNLIKNNGSANDNKHAENDITDTVTESLEKFVETSNETKSKKTFSNEIDDNLFTTIEKPEISVQDVSSTYKTDNLHCKNFPISQPSLRPSKLKLTKSSKNLTSLFSLDDPIEQNQPLGKTELSFRKVINEENVLDPSDIQIYDKPNKRLSNDLYQSSVNKLSFSISSNELSALHKSLNDLKSDESSTKDPDDSINPNYSLTKENTLTILSNDIKSSIINPIEIPVSQEIKDRTIRRKLVSVETEKDKAIEVKRITEFVSPELSAKTEFSSQRSGFDGSLLGGVTDHYVPDLILQGTLAKPISFETELRRDLDITTYLNKQLDSPAQAIAIIGDTNTWEVRVVGRECGTGGMSSLVAAMLEAVPAMSRAKVPAHQCLTFLEGKLREFCVLSKTLADMLMTTDFCDIATLTKSLNIDVNDVPLLLAVATTHTPQVATRYGISYR